MRGRSALLGLGIAVVWLALGEPAQAQHQGMHMKKAAPSGGHEGMRHGGPQREHGEIVPEAMDFPTTAYDEKREVSPPQQKMPPAEHGNPEIGKKLAYDRDKGRCLSCHVLGPDGEQPGTVGPNLSLYGAAGRDRAYTFQRIWDARVLNPATVMPPFGTNGLLSEQEAAHISAYLQSLKEAVKEPGRADRRARRDRVFIAEEDLSIADAHLDEGRAAFALKGNNGESCMSCHAAGTKRAPELRGAAASYPQFSQSARRVIGLEDRMNGCRARYMASDPLERGGRELNVLASYVKYLSRGVAIKVATQGPAAKAIERGRRTFARRAGQLNFSCASCHTDAAGGWLRGQRLRELDDATGDWPKHFIAEHDLGLISLQQRMRHCQIVTRTQPLALGSQEYTELELYLAARANGTPVWAPTNSRLRGQ